MRYIFILVIFLFVNAAAAQEEVIPAQDKIVAIVNHEVVTQSEVEELLAVFYMQVAGQYSEERVEQEMERMKQTALNRLIEDKLILEEAKKEKIEINDAMLQERLKEVKAKFKDESDFSQALSEQGLTPADFKRKLSEQIMMSAIVEQKIRKNISVLPSEITAYYQGYPDEFGAPESAQTDSILCASSEKAKEVLALLSAGKDFKEVAGEFSVGSPLGIIKKGELAKDIEDVIFNLAEGGVSGIVTAPTGFYIFKIIRRIPASKLSLAEAEAQIREKLMKRKMDKRFAEWMEDLKKNAYIIIK